MALDTVDPAFLFTYTPASLTVELRYESRRQDENVFRALIHKVNTTRYSALRCNIMCKALAMKSHKFYY